MIRVTSTLVEELHRALVLERPAFGHPPNRTALTVRVPTYLWVAINGGTRPRDLQVLAKKVTVIHLIQGRSCILKTCEVDKSVSVFAKAYHLNIDKAILFELPEQVHLGLTVRHPAIEVTHME